MHLTHLRTVNTQGHNFSVPLTKLVAVVAPNYAGKTALLDSIRLGLTGQLPNAKRNQDIFLMSSGTRMTINLELSDGGSLKRTWEKVGDSIRYNGSSTSVDVGADTFNIPLLNAGEYFAMTAGERLDYVASKIGLDEGGDVPALLWSVGVKLREEGIDPNDPVVDPIAEQVHSALSERGYQNGLNRLLEKGKVKHFTLPERHTYWNSRVKDTVGAVRLLSELKNRENECSAETLADIRAELTKLQKELQAANEKLGALQEAKAAHERSATRRQKIVDWLAKPKGADLILAQNSRKEYERLKALYVTFGKRGDSSESMKGVHSLAQKEMLRTEGELDAAKTQVEVDQRDIAALTHLDACPTCRAKKPGWKKVVLEELQNQLKNDESLLTLRQKQFDDATKAFVLIDEAMALREKQEEEERTVEHQMEVSKIVAEKAEKDDAIENQLIFDAKAELAAMGDETFDEQPFKEALAERDNIQLKIDLANTGLETATKLQQDIRRAVEAQQEHQDAETALKAVKTIGILLKEKQQQSTDKLIGGLLDTVNFFTAGIMRAPLELQDSELGYRTEKGRFVTNERFSGLEKMLAYLAFGAALSSKAELKIALPDEMGVLSPGMRGKVMERFREAVEKGILDQVVLAIPVDAEDLATNMGITGEWQIVKL